MSETLITKINALLESYQPQLNKLEIDYKLSKKYFELKTGSAYTTGNLLSKISQHLAKKREDKYYKHQNNRYHCLVLAFYPIGTDKNKKLLCKEYSFLLQKTERMEEGYAPKYKANSEEKILRKIEKVIKRIIRKAESKGSEKACAESWLDSFRYLFNIEYGYMKRISGKEGDFWDLLISFGIIATRAIVSLAICLIR